jgi:choline kinase
LICYTLDALQSVSVRTVHTVMGATSERLSEELEPLVPTGLRLNVIVNQEWQKQNGVSVLCADGKATAPFFLVMGDHLLEPAILETLLADGDRDPVNLAVDRKITSIFDLDDATKVVTAGDRVAAIGKDLQDYDAIDTGVFLCSDAIFDYLRRAQRDGDCSLSDGIRLMAADRKVGAIDIGDAWWQDVDTPEMLARAEEESARLLRDGRGRLAQERVAGER